MSQPGPQSTIHPEAVKKQMNWNVSIPQEMVDEKLPVNFQGTRGGGLPVKRIGYHEFPRVLYMHPNEPFETVEHRNDKFEVVSTDTIPTEHLVKTVHNEAELKAALEDGWVKEPYVPKAAPTRNAGLYGPKKKPGKAISA
jgi:hypothetical protein